MEYALIFVVATGIVGVAILFLADWEDRHFIDWRYPLMFGLDAGSRYKSLWLGWWLITWSNAGGKFELCISFQPGL